MSRNSTPKKSNALNEEAKETRNLTPKTRTQREMRSLNTTPRSKQRIRTKLLFANALVDEIKASRQCNTQVHTRQILCKVVVEE